MAKSLLLFLFFVIIAISQGDGDAWSTQVVPRLLFPPPPLLSKFVRHVTGILVQIWQAELFPGNERDERFRS